MPILTLDRAHQLLSLLLRENDSHNAPELFELIHGIASPDNLVALELEKRLFSLISDSGFDTAFESYRSGFGVEVTSAANS